MKFGKTLERHQIAEWADHYISYKPLNKELKAIAEDPTEQKFKAWDDKLELELSKVNKFFTQETRRLEEQITATRSDASEIAIHPPAEQEVRARSIEKVLAVLLARLDNLADFSSLNWVACYKILKKHDKVLKGLAPSKLQDLELYKNAPFHNQTAIESLREDVTAVSEVLGVDPEGNFDWIIRNKGQTAGSWISNLLYYFLGIVTMALVNIVLMLQLPTTNTLSRATYFTASFPVFRMVFMCVELTWLCGCCVYLFEKHKVNWIMLLNIDPKCQIQASHLFYLASLQTVVWLVFFMIYLSEYKFGLFGTGAPDQYALYPVAMIVVQISILFLPSAYFRVKYRYGVLRCLGSVVLSPAFRVTFSANVLGDVLTSFTRPLKDLIFTGCYILTGSFLTQEEVHCAVETPVVVWVILVLPYWFRLCQCCRRYYDSRVSTNLLNAGKYSMGIAMSAVTAIDWSRFGVTVYASRLLWTSFFIGATMYMLVWDVRMDWGLFPSVDTFLRTDRDNHFYPKPMYFAIASLNMILRTTWALNLIPLEALGWNGPYGADIVLFFVSAGEIYRRAQWVILRFEHEHLTNASKYRSVLWVPPLALKEEAKDADAPPAPARILRRPIAWAQNAIHASMALDEPMPAELESNPSTGALRARGTSEDDGIHREESATLLGAYRAVQEYSGVVKRRKHDLHAKTETFGDEDCGAGLSRAGSSAL
mmetsp:Transcript_48412/g.105379  ORF Transcript_48412/g.105379 Transcript_48412/m.105379 type:complete len:708 (-) Transcript_48412:532-2655(-)|eukprot:CAMPEP_0204332748 /NCGR_PEP_ID=MMETSP0469-20131031/16702_1 /ASSEMBLY_ACC=CAM_ASM_000384 /TAXON_ID=2969 /ORGANISM="Oxyrrhis marina" /LENGTH=707 /DNA_ID=CAMNT_0051315961 /DNA_START=37 /DNA_END=2160 /DNA_ORIENTATION=-